MISLIHFHEVSSFYLGVEQIKTIAVFLIIRSTLLPMPLINTKDIKKNTAVD